MECRPTYLSCVLCLHHLCYTLLMLSGQGKIIEMRNLWEGSFEISKKNPFLSSFQNLSINLISPLQWFWLRSGENFNVDTWLSMVEHIRSFILYLNYFLDPQMIQIYSKFMHWINVVSDVHLEWIWLAYNQNGVHQNKYFLSNMRYKIQSFDPLKTSFLGEQVAQKDSFMGIQSLKGRIESFREFNFPPSILAPQFNDQL